MNSEPPKVSVCVITYNHATYIETAIESVLCQNAPFTFEVVIGEDRSTDATRSICESLAKNERRVRLLDSKQNVGLMANFVRTLRACAGEYIAVCEGDDFWTDPEKIAQQVAFLDRNAVFAGHAHQSYVLRDGIRTGIFRENVSPILKTKDLLRGRQFHTASLLFRREALETVFECPFVYSGDRLLNLSVSLVGDIYYDARPMCVYRKHAGGASTTCTPEQLLQDLRSVPVLRKKCRDFPVYSYMSYIYATASLCRKATAVQKIYYTGIGAVLSFSDFPRNLCDVLNYLIRMLRRSVCARSA